MTGWQSIAAIAGSVRSGTTTARANVERALALIAAGDGVINAVVETLAVRALAEADAIDARVAQGEDPGPLAGVPFGVKALFDLAGLTTTAGSAVRMGAEPARRDAGLVARLRAAGAIPVAVLNMDEFAYGFATINAHHGTTRNPHDRARLAGGSSGGSAAAVAAGFLPLTLGSDTNGSIRVPAALCGVYGLRPAWDSVTTAGVFPFVESLDVVGPFTASAADLRLAGIASGIPIGASDGTHLRVARLGGWFDRDVDPAFADAYDTIAEAVGWLDVVELPDVERARAAAFLITAADGGRLHRDALARDYAGYDPATRDRLLAGCLLPDAVRAIAANEAARFRESVLDLFVHHDVLIAPAVPCVAPSVDNPVMRWAGEWVPARANLGILTQPLSLSGCPVLTAPLHRPGRLPLGLQLVAAPGRESALFALADRFERLAITGTTAPCAGSLAPEIPA